MIFVFGYHPSEKVIGPTEERDCPHCNNRRYWLLAKTTYYISLFFIPLIPTKIQRYWACPVCQYREDLAESEFDAYQAEARLNQEAVDRNMSEAEYQRRRSRL